MAEGNVFTLSTTVNGGDGGTPSPYHNTSNHWSHVLSGGRPYLHPIIVTLVPGPFLWVTRGAQDGMGYSQPARTGWSTPWERLCLDRLCCRWYISCGFTQEDFLVWFALGRLVPRCIFSFSLFEWRRRDHSISNFWICLKRFSKLNCQIFEAIMLSETFVKTYIFSCCSHVVEE